jgi:hypothetical protein
MNTNHATSMIDRVQAGAMVLAPLLLLAGTLSSLPDDKFAESVSHGVLQLFAFGMFFLAFAELAKQIAPTLPRAAVALLVTGVLGAQSGVAWGMVFIARDKGLELHAGDLAMAFDVGALFPLTVIGFGICILRTRIAPAWTGAGLALAGIAFPVSRIGMIGELALVADVLMLVSLAGVAVASFSRETVPAAQPALT